MWLPVSAVKRWGEAGSILEVLGYNMWLPVSAVKCWGEAGSILEVVTSNLGKKTRCLVSDCSLISSAPPATDGIADEIMLFSLVPKFFSVLLNCIHPTIQRCLLCDLQLLSTPPPLINRSLSVPVVLPRKLSSFS